MIRIGSVPYLNAKVLVCGLQPQTSEYTLEFHVPSVLSEKLRNGEVDVALVSSIEFYRNPDYLMLPDMAITGMREMWSIQLFHRVPLREARRVGMDPSSCTTNALLQIVLYEKLRLGIELVPLAAHEDPLNRADLDGFLKIGDPCLNFVPPPEYSALDLANEWHMFTNLPFVFASWLTRRGIDLEGLNQTLFLAKREGLRRADEIARTESARLGMDYLRTRNYLTRIVRYDLGRPELAGLDLFRKYLVRQGLISDSRPFEFYTR